MIGWLKRYFKNLKLAASYSRREAWFKRIMKLIEEIIRRPEITKCLPELVERYEYLADKSVLCVPMIDVPGFCAFPLSLPTNKSFEPLKVIPLVLSDGLLDPLIAYLYQVDIVAGYNAPNHEVVVKMDLPETDCFMASTLLHEVGHAILAEEHGRIGQEANVRSEEEILHEELQQWEFDVRLALFLGRSIFQSIIQDDVKKVGYHRLRNQSVQFTQIEGRLLDLCYGLVVDQRALKRRTGIYAIYCELLALDAYMGDKAFPLKIELMRTLRKQRNQQWHDAKV